MLFFDIFLVGCDAEPHCRPPVNQQQNSLYHLMAERHNLSTIFFDSILQFYISIVLFPDKFANLLRAVKVLHGFQDMGLVPLLVHRGAAKPISKNKPKNAIKIK